MGRRFLSLCSAVVALSWLGGAAQARLTPGQPQSSVNDRGNTFLRPSIDTPGSAFLRFFHEGEWYFSWGTSKQFWAPTDIHVSQPSQGNDFTIHGVVGHDEPGAASMLTGNLFGPQYNIRVGRFINDKRTMDEVSSFVRLDPPFV